MKYFLVSTDFGLKKGGIQVWAYYIIQFLKSRNLNCDFFYLKNSKFNEILKLFKANLSSHIFILMDWKKILFVIPSLFLTLLGVQKSRFNVFILGDEILNLSRTKKTLLYLFTRTKNIYFISDSNAISEIFKKEFNKDINYNCYPFIDAEHFISNSNRVKHNNNSRLNLFTVTRLAKRKNVENVVKAVKKLIESGQKIHYYIGGDGPEKDNIKMLIDSLDMNSHVTMLGRITDEEKIEYLNKSDIFLLPSLYNSEIGSIEGFGIVFIEANAVGVPVISGNTGGMLESVLDGITGFHCDGSVDDIVKKIIKSSEYKFNKNKIVEHALKFDYRNQDHFLDFINGKLK